MDHSISRLRYLGAIYTLSCGRPTVRSVDVARTLGVSAVAVSRMAAALVREGWILKRPYGEIKMTSDGVKMAQMLVEMESLFEERMPRLGVEMSVDELKSISFASACELLYRKNEEQTP